MTVGEVGNDQQHQTIRDATRLIFVRFPMPHDDQLVKPDNRMKSATNATVISSYRRCNMRVLTITT